MAILSSVENTGKKENGHQKIMKKFKMKILLWIQGWSSQLNSWAWAKWNRLYHEDWVKGYKKWKKK
tara:strand:+ start:148 stop:345 length:198 start_codon:yes stop_codon:yes gene_type:complete